MHSPTYKHGNYTKLMQIKLFIAQKSIEIALKYTKMTKSKKTSNDFSPELVLCPDF